MRKEDAIRPLPALDAAARRSSVRQTGSTREAAGHSPEQVARFASLMLSPHDPAATPTRPLAEPLPEASAQDCAGAPPALGWA
jgi:hypothetical protein